MSKMEQVRVGSSFAILKNGFEQKVEIWRFYLVIKKKIKKIQILFYVDYEQTLFFLSPSSKTP